MTKHTRMLVPALLAAGTMLLTACDLGGSTGATQQKPSATTPSSTAGDGAAGNTEPANSTPDDGAEHADEQVPEGSVDCGRHPLVNGRYGTHWLIVDPGIDGLVDCDTALTVVEDYLAAGDIRIDATEMANGWDCGATFEGTRLEGPVVATDCFKVPEDENRSGFAYQFRTKRV